MSGETLAIRDLCVGVRQADGPARRVVDGVSFTIEPGRMVALVGESGSGKTMIGRAVLRLLPPVASIESGEIAFKGEDLARASESRGRFDLSSSGRSSPFGR